MRPTKVHVRCVAGEANIWTVSLKVVDAEDGRVLHESPTSFCLTDPWTKAEYRDHFNADLSKKPRVGAGRVTLKDYGKQLANQLGLRHILDGHLCERLYVFEDFSSQRNTKASSIHSLLWEALEHQDVWPGLISASVPIRGPRIIRVILNEAKEPAQSLENVYSRKSCRILLVLARDVQVSSRRSCRGKEVSPGLIQNVLTSIARFLDLKGASSYLTLHVVRPGTFEQLGRFLAVNTYDIVHFDLHGHISEHERVAKLRFAVQSAYDGPTRTATVERRHGYDDQDIEKVAELLQKYRISKVALNSCKSAYALQSATTNMAHILVERGVTSVCAMSYDIYDDAAGTYYKAFYEAFILGRKDFHDAASFARQRLRRRFEKQVESDSSGSSRRESEYLIPVSYRNRMQTWKDEFNRPHIPLHIRCLLAIAATVSVLVTTAEGIAFSGYVDILRKSTWISRWISQALQILWNLFLAYIFWGVYTGSEPGMVLTRTFEYMRKVKDVAIDHFTQRDLHIQYRDYRKTQKRRGGGANDFNFCLGHMDLEEQLYRDRCLYVYHDDPARTRLRALVRIWIQTGFIDSATFKDANHFFDLGHRFCWEWTTKREGKRRRRGQNNPTDGRGPRALVLIENIDQFVAELKYEGRGRNITLDGEVAKDLDNWISCQGAKTLICCSQVLATGIGGSAYLGPATSRSDGKLYSHMSSGTRQQSVWQQPDTILRNHKKVPRTVERNS